MYYIPVTISPLFLLQVSPYHIPFPQIHPFGYPQKNQKQNNKTKQTNKNSYNSALRTATILWQHLAHRVCDTFLTRDPQIPLLPAWLFATFKITTTIQCSGRRFLYSQHQEGWGRGTTQRMMSSRTTGWNHITKSRANQKPTHYSTHSSWAPCTDQSGFFRLFSHCHCWFGF